MYYLFATSCMSDLKMGKVDDVRFSSALFLLDLHSF